MIEVRHAGVDDLEEVLGLWAAADAEPTVTDDADALRTLLDRDPDALLVARQGGSIVGTLIVGWDGWRGSFYRLAVLPGRRRRGVARRLVAAGESQLVGRGARRLAVFAVTGSPAAVPFWRAVGYRQQTGRARLVKNLEDDGPPPA